MVESPVWYTKSLHKGLDLSMNLGNLAHFSDSCPASNLLVDPLPNIPVHEQLLCGLDRGVREPCIIVVNKLMQWK